MLDHCCLEQVRARHQRDRNFGYPDVNVVAEPTANVGLIQGYVTNDIMDNIKSTREYMVQ